MQNDLFGNSNHHLCVRIQQIDVQLTRARGYKPKALNFQLRVHIIAIAYFCKKYQDF